MEKYERLLKKKSIPSIIQIKQIIEKEFYYFGTMYGIISNMPMELLPNWCIKPTKFLLIYFLNTKVKFKYIKNFILNIVSDINI